MNLKLSGEEIDALLQVLSRGLVLIRSACQVGDSKRAEVIADALHNLPHLLRERDPAWSAEEFRNALPRSSRPHLSGSAGLTDLWPQGHGYTRRFDLVGKRRTARTRLTERAVQAEKQ